MVVCVLGEEEVLAGLADGVGVGDRGRRAQDV